MYYPRSFLKLILLGFLLASAPLAYALWEMATALDQLARGSRVAVLNSAHASQASRQLLEQMTALERLVRQYMVLEDPGLLEDYARVRQEFLNTTKQLTPLGFDEVARKDIQNMVSREAALYGELSVTLAQDPNSVAQFIERYAGLTDLARSILVASNALAEREISGLQKTASQGGEKSLLLALTAGVVALVVALLFSFLIARPIRQIDQGIRQLGRADFTHPVLVEGPEDMRYLGQRLEWLRVRLADLEEQQNRFLRHISHELKTPLTAIREGAELLRDRVGGELSKEQDEVVRIVRENSLQLQKLIEDLLHYHQTRAMEPHSVGPVALGEVLRRVLREHKLAAFARGVTIEARLRPVELVGDAEKLRVVADNLISNAIKYSPRGGAIRVELAAPGNEAVLDVLDQGPGVRPEEAERIFESFYQGKAPAEGRVKGSGLGLAIAREYVLAHGGKVGLVLSQDSGRKGAHFRVVLPLGETARRQPQAAAAT
ncbi:two-component system, NtrC family, sensor histidine kinase GlrK [Burkholderiales bacterium]|nr:MAG: HAMP domain-containing histidine kinase [Burkholderiales bacterium]CAG0978437.1 two-component system, NtrC family, sensor histidine kinase GlrK [Burkholderiales bacterium]